MKYFLKVIRITAWLLVLVTGLTLLFGFLAYKPFITHEINIDLSMYFHNILLPLVFIPLFLIHSFCGTVIAIQRQRWIKGKRVWQFAAGVLWASVLVVFGVLYFIQAPPVPKRQTVTAQNTPGTNIGPATTLTLEEIQKHNTQNDCWMIISNKVYDLSAYLGAHPGGSSTMTPYCGTDGTQGFATKDKLRAQSHSSYASGVLDSYYLGDVGTQVNIGTNQGTQKPPAPAPNTSKEEDDD